MIIVSDRTLHIPPSEKRLGFTGDNRVESRVFEIKDTDLFSMEFRIDIEGKKNAFSAVPEKTFSSDNGTLYLCLDITSAMLVETGTITFQLRGFDTEGDRVWHSEKNFFYVSDAVGEGEEYTEQELSQFEIIEKNVASLYERARECAENAEQNFDEIKTFTQTEASKVRADFDRLDGHVTSLETIIGDIESATDEIIALQESFIGGEGK